MPRPARRPAAAPARGSSIPFSTTVKNRTELVFWTFAALYALMALRLAYIQLARHKEYDERATKWHSMKQPLLSRRGVIYSREGWELAVTIPCASVFAHPKQIPAEQREAVLEALSTALGQPVETLRPKIEAEKKFVWIARRVSLATATALRKLKLAGIGLQENETKRVYPRGTLAANLIGFTDVDGKGREGIEAKFNAILGGEDGLATALVDARRKPIADTQRILKPSRNGQPITLSIDYGLQRAAERELDKNAQQYQPAGSTCTVMDVNTGEILAMATWPRFDPNFPAKADDSHRRNRPVTDTYEPGSTLKTLTIAAALDSGAINLNSAFHCAGSMAIGKNRIRCVIHAPFHGGHGTVRAKEIIEHSCNIGAAQVGMVMGQTRLKEYMERFGLGHKTGIELTAETGSSIPLKDKNWARIVTANVAFGQGIAVTPLQLLTAYAAVANGGRLIEPTILKRSRPAPFKQIISPQAAAETRELIKACVTDGTGKPAKIAGYGVGGKTGSAQKVTPGLGYRGGKFIASFASVLPIEHPRIAILVTVDEPKGTHWGAVAAAPVVREVARQAVIELGIPPDDKNDLVDGASHATWKKVKKVKRA